MADGQSTIPGWFWKAWTLVAVIALGAVAYRAADASYSAQDTVAEQWIRAVSTYGIEPVYPPQEDLYVGDVFAFISGDAKEDILTEPLPTRALKLKHLDLTAALEHDYAQAYHFPATTDAPENGKVWTQGQADGSVFAGSTLTKNLPVALLPDFTITAKKKAVIDTSALSDLAADLGLSVSRERRTQFKLEGILTYGVSAIDAEIALAGFCSDKKTKSICSDASLRLLLTNILGDAINQTITQNGVPRPRYSVELAIVSRVYLIRRIETSINDASGLDLHAKTDATPPPATPSGSASVDSERGSTVSVSPQTFERPLAFGFRTVRYNVGD